MISCTHIQARRRPVGSGAVWLVVGCLLPDRDGRVNGGRRVARGRAIERFNIGVRGKQPSCSLTVPQNGRRSPSPARAPSVLVSPFHGQQNTDSRLPGPYPLDKKFNWRTVTPTFREIKPFDQHVEGLSRCGTEGCAIEAASVRVAAAAIARGTYCTCETHCTCEAHCACEAHRARLTRRASVWIPQQRLGEPLAHQLRLLEALKAVIRCSSIWISVARTQR